MSTDNVVILPVMTTLDIPAERVLGAALDANLKHVLVVGLEQDGKPHIACTWGDDAKAIWWLRKAEQHILENGEPKE